MPVDVHVASPNDYDRIVAVVDDWWGRPVVAGLPRLFLDHFWNTSRVAEDEQGLAAFLVAFMSPAQRRWPTSTSWAFGPTTARPGWPARFTASSRSTPADMAAGNCARSLPPATPPPSASTSVWASPSTRSPTTTTAWAAGW